MNKMLRLLLCINSFFPVILFLVIWKIDMGYYVLDMLKKYGITHDSFKIMVYVICVCLLILVTIVTLKLINRLWKKVENIHIIDIKPIEFTLMPVYLSLFVIVLGFWGNKFNLENNLLLLILFIFWYNLERTSYFNPMWLFWWLRFYEVKTSNNVIIMLITKDKDLKWELNKENLIRINNFTFLDL